MAKKFKDVYEVLTLQREIDRLEERIAKVAIDLGLVSDNWWYDYSFDLKNVRVGLITGDKFEDRLNATTTYFPMFYLCVSKEEYMKDWEKYQKKEKIWEEYKEKELNSNS